MYVELTLVMEDSLTLKETSEVGYSADRFIEEVNNDLICPICVGVFRKVRLTSTCKHNFCKKCLSKWLYDHSDCPYCRTKISSTNESTPNEQLQDTINQMKLRCFHASKGCLAIESVERIDIHDRSCLFARLDSNCKHKQTREICPHCASSAITNGQKSIVRLKRKLNSLEDKANSLKTKVTKINDDLINSKLLEQAQFYSQILQSTHIKLLKTNEPVSADPVDYQYLLSFYNSSLVDLKKQIEILGSISILGKVQKLFYDSVESNNIVSLSKLLNIGGINLDAKNKQWSLGPTALIKAAESGYTDICRTLLAANARVDIRDDVGQTALMIAAVEGNLDICICLVYNGADINAVTSDSKSVLFNACSEPRRLRKAIKSIEETGYDSRMLLHFIAETKRKQVVEFLLDRKITIDPEAVVEACSRGRLDILKLFHRENHSVMKGATNKKGLNTLIAAAKAGYEDVCKWLLDLGVDINSRSVINGCSALHLAASKNHDKIVRLLISKGANVNAQTSNHELTPLMMAAGESHESIVFELLMSGADPFMIDAHGFRPEDHANSSFIRHLIQVAKPIFFVASVANHTISALCNFCILSLKLLFRYVFTLLFFVIVTLLYAFANNYDYHPFFKKDDNISQ